ncbi:MAG: hypothetical protein HC836_49015 [Richelia sp. RM2_1_2]|nr:hypothetical protein [Richelia sp. RM2_1_2]
MGIDTWIRMFDIKNYQNNKNGVLNAHKTLAERGIKLLVFGRKMNGCFLDIKSIFNHRHVEIDSSLLLSITKQVPQDVFDKEISSTEIRLKSNLE